VLRVKLPHLDSWTEARQRNAARYAELFRAYDLLDAIDLPEVQPERRHVFNQYCVRVRAGLRDLVLASLREKQIGCSVYYPKPLHLQACFSDLGYRAGSLPEAEQAARDSLALPIFPELKPHQQEIVVRGIAAALERSHQPASHPALPRPKFLSVGSRLPAQRLEERRESA
jgi:dTDP-4-amino-4,6-dideoxygalactose transaminase